MHMEEFVENKINCDITKYTILHLREYIMHIMIATYIKVKTQMYYPTHKLCGGIQIFKFYDFETRIHESYFLCVFLL